MAGSLKLAVTAEGVETEEQMSALRAQSCDQVQGYLTGRPVPQAALSALIKFSSESVPERAPMFAATY
jgi:EAL domain-containing protein (putative c-di-GMP-specific phosphodiesterase class I)